MRSIKNFSILALTVLIIYNPSIASAAEDAKWLISTDPVDPSLSPEATELVLGVNYATDPAGTGAPGFGIKTFWDGSLLKRTKYARNQELGGFYVGSSEQADTDDLDNDPKTTMFRVVSWIGGSGEDENGDSVAIPWPEIEFAEGVKLFDLTFDRVDAAFVGKTTVNFVLDSATGFVNDPSSVDVIFKDDETPPVVTLDADSVSVEAGFPLTTEDNTPALADFIATITVTDNKDTLTTDSLDAFVLKDGELVAAPEGFAPGTYEITFIASDSSGNESEGVVVSLTVTDTTKPILSGVANVALSAVTKDGAPSAGILAATALDSVDGQVAVAYSVGGADVGDNFPLGETTVTVKAADNAGNMAEGTLVVTVSDTTNPVIVSAAGVALEADGELGYGGSSASIIAAIGVSDNVDDAPVVTLGASVPEVLPFGVTQVAVVVTDAAGNATEGTVPVTVADTTKPEFSGANLLVLTVDAADEVVASDDARVTTWLAGVTATDIVDGATDVTNSDLPSTFAVGEVVITFTSVDSRGNEATAEVTVLVTVGPAVTVADAITVVSLDGAAVPASQTQIAAFIAAASATDFSGAVLDVTNDAPDTFAIGDTLVTFSAVDADDRQGQNSSTVTVVAASAENDTDNDGMDDLFEVDNGLDPNADDAEADADGDGRSNLDEYLEGIQILM